MMSNRPDLPRTLYVGNLDPQIGEQLLTTIFRQLGELRNCKVIREPNNEVYAFIEYTCPQSAQNALNIMNGRKCLDREIRVNWASSATSNTKVDTSKHFHVFVGDLSQEVDVDQLREAFQSFGEISDVKVVRDAQSNKPKGYGFVSFVNRENAEVAIESMNGHWLGLRQIRTNWATRKVQPESAQYSKMDYSEVFNRASESNTTVYVGNLPETLCDEEKLKTHFSAFGEIKEVRVFKDKGFAFIRYSSKGNACQAIVSMHGVELQNSAIKCSWGKESEATSTVQPARSGPIPHMLPEQPTPSHGQYQQYPQQNNNQPWGNYANYNNMSAQNPVQSSNGFSGGMGQPQPPTPFGFNYWDNNAGPPPPPR
ncbi:hypothetical protein SNEBB_009533 [Seison nebaliae]|nr:hypothetical protein SNEBB_009533 [Seison nebaliae]